jgi:hypothetical protein
MTLVKKLFVKNKLELKIFGGKKRAMGLSGVRKGDSEFLLNVPRLFQG